MFCDPPLSCYHAVLLVYSPELSVVAFLFILFLALGNSKFPAEQKILGQQVGNGSFGPCVQSVSAYAKKQARPFPPLCGKRTNFAALPRNFLVSVWDQLWALKTT